LIIVFTFTDALEANKFEYLFKKYKGLLYFKAFEILHDQMAAEDALSETMIRVYRNIKKINDPDSPESASFLTTIVRNVSLTLLKKQKSAPELLAMEADDEPYDEQAYSFDLEATVIDTITEEKLCLALDKLDEESRNIIMLKYAHDLSHREIAELLNLTENNVTVRLHRTRKKLTDMAVKEELFA